MVIKIIEESCLVCGKKMNIYPSQNKRGRGKYCSEKCSAIGRSNAVERFCIICGKKVMVKSSKAIKFNNTYCSYKCSGVGKRKKKIQKICVGCGVKFMLFPSEIKRGRGKYCSKGCHSKNISKEKNSNWNGGKSFEPYPLIWNKGLKKSIRDRDNNKCMRCGKAREEFRYALCVHHIDANKNNCNPNNLISLCGQTKGSCHGLTIGKENLFAEKFRKMLSKIHGYKYDEDLQW